MKSDGYTETSEFYSNKTLQKLKTCNKSCSIVVCCAASRRNAHSIPVASYN